jgi:hypothetical protein
MVARALSPVREIRLSSVDALQRPRKRISRVRSAPFRHRDYMQPSASTRCKSANQICAPQTT